LQRPGSECSSRAGTQHSRDASTVWGKVQGPSTRWVIPPPTPILSPPGAVAWLKVTVAGAEEGLTGGDTLTRTTFIQRLNTSGGLAPSTGVAGTRSR